MLTGNNNDDDKNDKKFEKTVDCFGPLHLLALLRKVGIVIRSLKIGLVISFVLFLFM